MSTLSKLLQEAKELNVPRPSLMTREDIQKAIKDNIRRYKEIIFGVNSLMCINENL